VSREITISFYTNEWIRTFLFTTVYSDNSKKLHIVSQQLQMRKISAFTSPRVFIYTNAWTIVSETLE